MTLQEKAIAASNKRNELAAECNTKWMPLNTEEENIIDSPKHYTQGKIEVIDFILDQKMDYLTGTVQKYIARWRFKGGVCDLKKARWFLDKLIEIENK
jgi:hypothetical protein